MEQSVVKPEDVPAPLRVSDPHYPYDTAEERSIADQGPFLTRAAKVGVRMEK